MNNKFYSPFEPRTPVSPENLEGRIEIINDYKKYINLTIGGRPQHFFIFGNRGIGKSSIAAYLLEYVKQKHDFIGIHVYNDGVKTTDDLINNIIEKILNEIQHETWSDKITNYFKDHIESVGLFGNLIKFKPSNHETTILKENFDRFIVDFIESFEDKNGLFIVVDDINGLSKTPEFANWYKSFADTLATNYKKDIPLCMLLTSHPKVVDDLYNHNNSFNRIFVYREITPLSEMEIKEFFIKNFNNIGVEIPQNALNLMVEFSAGSPTMMQEIGDAIYWINDSDRISRETAFKGIEKAADEIELRFLSSALKELNRDDVKILSSLAHNFMNSDFENYSFKKDEIYENMSIFEEKILDDFLNKALMYNIIETRNRYENEYKFTNNLFPIYFSIKRNNIN